MRKQSPRLSHLRKSLSDRPAKRFGKTGLVKVVSVVAALLLLAAACSSDTDSDSPNPDSATADQGTDSSAGTDRGLGVPQNVLGQLEDCGDGSLCGEVPGEDGEPVRYRVIPATDSESPAGLIAFHFGGPAGSPRETIRGFGEFLGPSGASFVGRFDLLGVEQRGTDLVDGVDCGNDALFHRIQTGTAPIAERAELAQQWISGCPAESYGSVTTASDTAAVLRHLDAGRTVFAGTSYGGVIAVLLGQNHADTVDAIFMDSPSTNDWIDPRSDLVQAGKFSNAFERFLASCDETLRCRFAPDGNAEERFRSLIDIYEVPGDLAISIGQLLGSEQTYPVLDDMLARAIDGDDSIVTDFATEYHGREGESYPPSAEIFPLVVCADGRPDYTDDHNEVLDNLRSLGVLGELLAKGAPSAIGICDAWSGEAEPYELDLSQSEVPVLIVASTNDPAVPWEDVKAFVETSLPEQSAAVVVNDFMHTQWQVGNRCIDEVANAFILDSTLPTISSPAGYEECAALEAAGS